MRKFIIQFLSCFVFPRKYRKQFRERLLKSKRWRSCQELLEEKIDTLTRLILLKELVPNSIQSLSVLPNFPSELLQRLQFCNFENNDWLQEIRSKSTILQCEFLKDAASFLPQEIIGNAFFKLFTETFNEQYKKQILNDAAWFFQRTGNFTAQKKLLSDAHSAGMIFSAWLKRCEIVAEIHCGNTKLAEKVLDKYLQEFGEKDLWKRADLAKFAYKNGIATNQVSLVNEIIEISCKNVERFKQFLHGKHIAVVGNGPQELNRGNGKKIDDYDIVLRFNDFPDDKKFAQDYGTKTDIWLRSAWVPCKKNIPKNLSFFIFGDLLYTDELPDLELLTITKSLVNMVPATAIPKEIFLELQNNGILFPTSGALILTLIKRICPKFSSEDVFGFSFKDEIRNLKLDHYYHSPNLEKGTVHSLDKERNFLRNLFNLND